MEKNFSTEQVKEIVQKLEKDYDFNDYLLNYVDEKDIDECESIDEVIDLFNKANEDEEITRTDVIYYTNAIEYLKEHDPSLSDSLEKAHDMGYTADKINSELLASICKSDDNLSDFGEFLNRLENDLEKN